MKLEPHENAKTEADLGIDAGTIAHKLEADLEIQPNTEHGHNTGTVLKQLQAEGVAVKEVRPDGTIVLPSITDEKCLWCKWWQRRGQLEGQPIWVGACRRFPPVVEDPMKLAVYPITTHEMLCGEYIAKGGA